MKDTLEECCPKFDIKKWDKKLFQWKNKKFIKETIPEFFHIPFPPIINKKVTKMMNLAKDAKCLNPNKEEILLLFKDLNPFLGEISLSVTDNVPRAKNSTLSGTFISKVFEGAFKEIPKFIKKMDSYLKEQGKQTKSYYIHYAYCPKCAKKFGHNFMILFAEIKA